MAELDTGIYRSIELRDYDKLEKCAREVISDKGWIGFLRILSENQTQKMPIPGWNIPVRRGPLRDALIHLLGLEIIIGLDCDYIHDFSQIESNNLNDVRNQAFPIVIDFLREQVERRNTFFLDTDAFSTTPYAVLVKDIINARTAEIEELPSKPSLRKVYSTYYGFTVLTSGRTSSYHAGATEKGVKYIEDLAEQFGKQTKLNARIFQPSSKAFTNCSSDTKEILWNLLRIFNGGWDTRTNAVKKIGEIGDSRSTPYLIMNLKNINNAYFKPALLKALGEIGDPIALDSIMEQLDDPRLRRTTIISLGGIRHPRALEKLIQIKDSNNRRDLNAVITALGSTRINKAFDVLVSFIGNRNGTVAQKTIEALYSMGKRGIDELIKSPSKLAESLKRIRNPVKLIHILKRIPNFQWTSELQDAVARAIGRISRAPSIINEILSIPELTGSRIVIDSILKHIEKISRYRWSQWHMRRLLGAGKIQKLLAKVIRISDHPLEIICRISKCPELVAHPEIKLAIDYVTKTKNPPKSAIIKQEPRPIHFIAKRELSPKATSHDAAIPTRLHRKSHQT